MKLFKVTIKPADTKQMHQGRECGMVFHPRVAEFVVCETMDQAVSEVKSRYKPDATVLAVKQVGYRPVIVLAADEPAIVSPPKPPSGD